MRVVSDEIFERAVRAVRLILVVALTLGLATIFWFIAEKMNLTDAQGRVKERKERLS